MHANKWRVFKHFIGPFQGFAVLKRPTEAFDGGCHPSVSLASGSVAINNASSPAVCSACTVSLVSTRSSALLKLGWLSGIICSTQAGSNETQICRLCLQWLLCLLYSFKLTMASWNSIALICDEILLDL